MTHRYGPVTPPKEFTSDGCSGGMSWLYAKLTGGKELPWHGCCRDHDLPYWLGGTWRERAKADRGLRGCVQNKGGPWYYLLGWIMWAGVRVGGMAAWPTKYRWGYGWSYPQSGPAIK